MMLDLRNPLLLHVLIAGGGDHTEADEEDIGLGVGEWSESVVVLLTRGVEESQCVGFPSDHHCHCIVVKNLKKKTKISFHRTPSQGNFKDLINLILIVFLIAYRWNIFRGKFVCSVGDQKTSLSHCTIPHHNTLKH